MALPRKASKTLVVVGAIPFGMMWAIIMTHHVYVANAGGASYSRDEQRAEYLLIEKGRVHSTDKTTFERVRFLERLTNSALTPLSIASMACLGAAGLAWLCNK